MKNKFDMSRRSFVKTSAVAMTAAAIPSLSSFSVAPKQIGISVWSYYLRTRPGGSEAHPSWPGAYEMAVHCNELGAAGAQVLSGGWDAEYAKKMRDLKENTGMWLEGQVRMPRSESDVDRFEKDIQMAQEGGVNIARAACLSGRRYVTFKNLEDWNAFKKTSLKSIRLAEPVVRRNKFKLAIENHKDWTADELVDILKGYDSEWLGCTLDTGNNLSFLENPYDVVEKLAPYAFTTHFKDMGIEEYEDGLLLSEAPFGQGFLDLNRMIYTLKKYNSNIKFNLEMMTRDPLKIPYLTEGYWTTFGDRTGQELAKSIKLLKENYSEKALKRSSQKTFHEQLALEEANQIACLDYARNVLGML